VELQIEKELGFKSKSEIEKYGIAKFNKLAKESVWRFKEEWDKLTERIGFWIDLENPFITYDVKYMESLWWIIKSIWQRGLLEEDYKVVPYCPRCETPLSSHEVALGYEDVSEESIYVEFPLKGKKYKNNFLLAWTTTPWTLPGNVALAVNPKIDYVWIRLKQTGKIYILAKAQLKLISGPFELIKEVKGKNLVGLKYEPIFDSLIKKKIPNIKNAFRVLPADFASEKEGTGIVHTAVMYGEEDFELGRKYNLPKYHTVDEHGRFTKDVKRWQGKFVKAVESKIIQDLERRNLIYKREVITHTYPFCWRCKTPLLYYAHKSWFVRMSRLKRQLIANNKKINWVPGYIKEGRFGEWLREIKDWAFSRDRYWGTPLPIWICQKCGKKHAVGSLDELSEMAYDRNNYYKMRHGGATHIDKGYIAGWPEKKSMV
ncbi:MAG: class I tRNA ligase family protein, partial [Candidatus Paceibacteria bacterium]